MAQEPQPQRVYVHSHDVEAARAAIAALGSQIPEVAVQPLFNPVYGNVARLTFNASEEALRHFVAIGPSLVELAALPTYRYVGSVSFRVLTGEALDWFGERGVRVIERRYKRWSAKTILTSFTVEAPTVAVLEEAKRYLQDRIATLHPDRRT